MEMAWSVGKKCLEAAVGLAVTARLARFSGDPLTDSAWHLVVKQLVEAATALGVSKEEILERLEPVLKEREEEEGLLVEIFAL